MKKFVVTITREFGSLGRPIAKRLAELLNVEYYDRDIVEAAAKKMNLPVSVISSEGILYYRRTLCRLCSGRRTQCNSCIYLLFLCRPPGELCGYTWNEKIRSKENDCGSG